MFYYFCQKVNALLRYINTIVEPGHFARDRHGRDSMVVGFTTTNAISVYHH